MNATTRRERLAEKYAWKFRADAEIVGTDPTDNAFALAFAGCAMCPKPDMYPLIREALARINQR